MCIVAYFIDYYRGMYIGLVFGLGIFLSEYFDLPVALVLGAVLIAVPGVILLIRFIRQYPVQSNKVEHDTPRAS
jgi:tetrahydromethanopterin S-methyltransferase subunit E